MSNIVKFNAIEDKIINIRNQPVLLNRDVAEVYGVETREINQSIKNNPDKFPEGYIIPIEKSEWENLKSKILTPSWGGTRKLPNVFTEKGLYMLAAILKSPQATQTTVEINFALMKFKHTIKRKQ